jgi:hypothetical protein
MNQLPDWAQALARVIDPNNNPYFGTFGGLNSPEMGHQSLGSGTGEEYARLMQAMRPGEQMMEAMTPDNRWAQWLQAPDGSAREVETGTYNDQAFMNAALAAAAVTGLNIHPGLLGGMGGSAPATGGAAGAGGGASAGGITAMTGVANPGILSGMGTMVPASQAAAGIGTPSLLGGGGFLSNLGNAMASNPLQTAAIAAGALGGAQPQGGGTASQTSQIDPRMAEALYGGGGFLPAVQDWFGRNQSGTNPMIQAGQQMQLGLLQDPRIMQQLEQMRTQSMGLLDRGVARNPFLGG